MHFEDRRSSTRRRPESRLRHSPNAPAPRSPSRLAPQTENLPPDYDYLCPGGQTVVAGNDVDLLRNGAEALPLMLEAIRGAKHSIAVEMYCFADDFIGCRFARALVERAAQGVVVRVLVDSAGCRRTPRSFFGWMRERGVRVQGVNPLRKYLLHGALFRWRDHRKLVVIDGTIAFVGGLNLSREFAPAKEGGCGWRDAAIRITGPIVSTLAASFESQWREETKTADRQAVVQPVSTGDTPALVLQSRPIGPGTFASVFRHAIERARQRIWIANPYFLPPRSLRRALRRAARRGVDVRVLVPRRSDCSFVLRASQRAYAYFLRSGIRLFEWTGTMMHTKAAVVDGLWSTIGSYNIDPLSLLHNRELNVVLLGAGPGRRFEAMLAQDFSCSEEVEAGKWSSRGSLRRLSEQLCASFRVFL